MEVATIQAERRQPGNRHAAERLRRSGKLPAVIYGHGQAPEHVAVSTHDAIAAVEAAAHVIELVLDGRKEQYLLKDVQFDHLQKLPMHLDLMRVDVNEKVTVKVPLEYKGRAVGVHEGGVLIHVMSDVEVQCTVLSIPASIVVKVDALELGQSIHVRDLHLPVGITTRLGPDEIVAVCRLPRGGAEEAAPGALPEGEAAAEPEVISKGKIEEEGEAEK
jgi:large subunit ribosomal protein L25